MIALIRIICRYVNGTGGFKWHLIAWRNLKVVEDMADKEEEDVNETILTTTSKIHACHKVKESILNQNYHVMTIFM